MDYPDIYYYPPYLELFERSLCGKATLYRHCSALGEVCYAFHLRPVEIGGMRKDCFDTITPHSYGGPVITKCVPGEEADLMREFNAAFSQYCQDQRIVSEFIRFHPVLKNVIYCKEIYSATQVGHTVAIDLLVDDLFLNSFTRRCRQNIRSARKQGVEIVFDFSCETIANFKHLYTLTMQKNSAADYYYFSDDFFLESVKNLKNQLFIVNAVFDKRIVGAAMFLCHEKYLHYHLSSTHPDYYSLSSSYLVQSEVAQWGKNNGFSTFHLGGGLETLLFFKRSFVKEGGLCDLWIGKKIRNQDLYDRLVEEATLKGTIDKPDFFPLYRG